MGLSISLLEPHVYSENEYETLRSVIAPMIAKRVVLFSDKK